MSLKTLLEDICKSFPAVRHEQFSQHPVAQKIRTDLKNELLRLVEKYQSLKDTGVRYRVKASPGSGNWADVVWAAIFDLEITDSAQRGFYPVYLFKPDGSGVYLSLNQGTTDTAEAERESIRSRVRGNQAIRRWGEENINLESNTAAGLGYESPNITAKFYRRGQVPSDDLLEHDLFVLLDLYQQAKNELIPPFGVMEPQEKYDSSISPLNQVLYGPPGTGKTFHTVGLALSILEPKTITRPDSIQALKQAYPGQVEFVTFHQSFSYEDFVEGIQAKAHDGKISYEIVDGVFKQLCLTAQAKVSGQSSEPMNLASRNVWKMSLGNTLQNEDFIYEECLENNYVLLGWGGDIDFSDSSNRGEVHEKMSHALGETLEDNNYAVTSVNVFKNIMQTGDLIIVSDGNSKFRAVAEVTGEYEFLVDDSRTGFKQKRPVRWLKTFAPSLPASRIFDKSLSQMTLYQLKAGTLNFERFQALLSTPENDAIPKPHVLIIDEINRGNISRIFGELITLIESSKRAGNDEAIEVTLPYSKESFSVPNNLYIIGTMNTADRSLALMDTALRRRFDFIEMMPDSGLVAEDLDGINVRKMLEVMNQRIEALYDREHTLGHAFLMNVNSLEELRQAFKNKILPLLEEYFYDDWQKIRWVLGEAKDYFYENQSFNNLFTDSEVINTGEKFKRSNKLKNLTVEQFQAIYQGT